MEIRRRFAVEGSIEGSGSAVLEIETAVLGHAQRIYPALLWGDGSAVLVDSAYPGKEGELLDGAKLVLGSTEPIAALLITHQDIDHIGGGKASSRCSEGPSPSTRMRSTRHSSGERGCC